MFVGHYGAGLIIKGVVKEAPLGALFVAVQLVDLAFFPLAMLGIEELKIVPRHTASTHFELPFMPYTHSLAAFVVWSLLAYAVARWVYRASPHAAKISAAVAAGVFSHWVLDVIAHTPDLPLAGNDTLKLGLGLWHYPVATFVAEALLLLAGLWLCFRRAQVVHKTRWIALVVALLASNALNVFGPPLGDTVLVFGSMAMLSYLLYAGVAFWLDRGEPDAADGPSAMGEVSQARS